MAQSGEPESHGDGAALPPLPTIGWSETGAAPLDGAKPAPVAPDQAVPAPAAPDAPSKPPLPGDIAATQGNQGRRAAVMFGAVLLGAILAFSIFGRDSTDAVSEEELIEPVAITEPLPPAAGPPGMQTNPYGYGETVAVQLPSGAQWNVRVSAPVEAPSGLAIGTEPPRDFSYVVVDVDATLAAATTQPASAGEMTWSIVGGMSGDTYGIDPTGRVWRCDTPSRFERDGEVLAGGTISGEVCIAIPTAEVGHANTGVLIEFAEDIGWYFGPDGSIIEPFAISSDPRVDDGVPIAAEEQQVALVDDGEQGEVVWNARVGELRDMTVAEVPEGMAFVGFELDLTLASADEPPVAISPFTDWQVIGGATNRVYQLRSLWALGCDRTEGSPFPGFSAAFVGAELSGTVCIPIASADVGHPDTVVAYRTPQARYLFEADAENSPEPRPLQSPGLGSLPAAWSLGEPIEVSAEHNYGEGGFATWRVTVMSARDVTDAVNTASTFIGPPSEGTVYYGFDIEFVLVESASPVAPAAAGSWEILGAESLQAYSTVHPFLGTCGGTPFELDYFTPIQIGESAEGTLCFAIAEGDVTDPDSRISLNRGRDQLIFELE